MATGVAAGVPFAPSANSATALDPALSTKSRFRDTERETGLVPADGTVPSSESAPPATANVEIELLPAFTTYSRWSFSLRASADWDASGSSVPPIPTPPVLNVPPGVSAPSAARAKATTALPLAAFVVTNTPPTAGAPFATSRDALGEAMGSVVVASPQADSTASIAIHAHDASRGAVTLSYMTDPPGMSSGRSSWRRTARE